MDKLNRPCSPEKHMADLKYVREDRRLSVDEGKITLSHRVLVIRIPVLTVLRYAVIIASIWFGVPEIAYDLFGHLPAF